MKMSKEGLDKLIEREGSRTKAYKDSVGVWTIGVGHTANAGPPSPKAGMVISQAEVHALLAKDIVKFEKRVNDEFAGHDLPQNVFDGAVSFDFNTGAIDHASWTEVYKTGNMKLAAEKFMAWRKPPEIIGRRKSECMQIFGFVP